MKTADRDPRLDDLYQAPVEWNATDRPYPEATIHEVFARQAARSADDTALIFDGGSWSYRQLDERARRLAAHLRRIGVDPGTPVGLMMERGPEMIAALLAILEAGGAYVPLDPEYPRERLAFMVEDTGLAVIIGERHLQDRLPGDQARLIFPSELPDDDELDVEALPPVTTDHLAYVCYTSGSTGRPKGVAIPHRGVLRLVFDTSYARFGPDEICLHMAPISFDAATFEIWGTLLHGGQLVLYPPGKIAIGELAAFLEKTPLTTAWLTAGLFHQLIEHAPTAIRGLHQLLTGGDALSASHVRRALHQLDGHTLIDGYGPTECTTFAVCNPLFSEQDLVGDSVPIGRPIANTRAYVLDARARPVAVGEEGELYLGGDGLAQGYFKRGALSAERFVPDPFAIEPGGRLYRTGDLVSHLPDGRLLFHGRRDHQVKIRGFRIELGEIEAALLDHPGVRSAVVVARGSAGEKTLVAYAVRQEDSDVRGDELRDFLGQRLPAYMLPGAFVFLPSLPLDPNGKVDRKALPEPDSARPDLATAFAAPENATQAELARLWAELLGLDEVGIDDHFLELGGHSLLIGRLATRIRRQFGVDLSLRELYAEPTVRAMAVLVDGRRQALTADAAIEGFEPAPRDRPVPLSFPQERVWFLQRLAPDNIAYNSQATLRLRGPLRIAALTAALQAIVRRHTIFRTSFPEIDGVPMQVIVDTPRISPPVIDLGALSPCDQARHTKALEAAWFNRPYDLLTVPLARWALLRFDDSDHMLLQSEHHFVHDGWSLAQLLSELERFYGAILSERPLPAEQPAQFIDYAWWQRRWMQGSVLEQYLDFWTKSLAGYNDHHDLPFDRPRPKAQSFRGKLLRIHLDLELCRALRRFSRDQAVTLFTTMFSAFSTLLYRYGGQDDLLVGSGFANRGRRELEQILGMVVNTLVLRVDLGRRPTFRELLGRVRETCMGALAHQDMPLDRLVEALDPERDPSRNPLFQTMFSFHDSAIPDLNLQDLESELTICHNGSAKLDLNVICIPRAEQRVGRHPSTEADEDIEMLFEYSTELFDESTVRRLMRHYLQLLRSAVVRPSSCVEELPLLPDSERHQVLYEGSDKDRAFPRERCVDDLFVDMARQHGDAIAISQGHRAVTYGEVQHRVDALAGRLRQSSVGPEDLVGVCFERRPEMVVSLLAILRAGAAFLPLDQSYPAERLAFMLEDAGVELILTQADLAGGLDELGARTLIVEEAVGENGAGENRAGENRAGENRAGENRAGDSGAETVAAVGDPQNLAYVMYTSGSTGRPKGVAVTHRNIVRLVRDTDYARLDAEQSFLQFAPISFDASTLEIWGPLLNGGRLVLHPPGPASLTELATVLGEERVSGLWLTAGLFHQMVELDVAALRPVAQLLAGGDVLRPEAVRKVLTELPQTVLINGYGPTETTTFACCHPMREPSQVGASVSIGRPIANARVAILDRFLAPQPIGVAGELFIGGDGTARGYLRRPALTAERFVPDPLAAEPGERLYRTGDRVRWLTDLRLEFLGRLDHQVKLRGFRVELGEIESALASHPEVESSVVVLFERSSRDQQLVAYWVPREGVDAPEKITAELRDRLTEALPSYMVPSAFVALDELPLTPNGKVDRRALPAPSEPRPREDAAARPLSPMEEMLTELWAEVLGVEHVGVDEDFFELGGHSLMATRLVARVRQALAVELPLRDLFAAPTVGQLAELLEATLLEGEEERWPPLVPMPRDDAAGVPLSFAQESLWLLEQLEPGQAVYHLPVVLRFDGSLDVAALGAGLGELERRHEVLRTRFVAGESAPVQDIAAPGRFELPLIVLDSLDASSQQDVVESLMRAEALRPFDLQRGPVWRASLLRQSVDVHVLLLTLHHIVADGWSMGVLLRELRELYDAATSGRAPDLAPLPIQVADFALWQRRCLSGEALERQVQFWRAQLGDDAPPLELPFDHPRPERQSHRGGLVAFVLPGALCKAVESLGRRHAVTPFMTLLAAFDVLLHRHTGQRRLAVGTPIAGRQQLATEGLIGFFVNTLVLADTISPRESFAGLLPRVRARTLEAFAHQELPFEKLVEELQPERNLSYNPLFQVMFAVEQPSSPRWAWSGGLGVDFSLVHNRTAKFDLTLTLTLAKDGWQGALEYASDLFEDVTVRRLAEHLEVLLTGLVEAPDTPVGRLPVLTPSERFQVLEAWNDTAVAREATSLYQLFAAQAAQRPDAIAVTQDELGLRCALTYGALARRVDQLAWTLHELGAGPEERVAILAHRSPEQIVALLAALQAGAAYVALDPQTPDERLATMIDDAAPVVILAEPALASRLPKDQRAPLIELDRRLVPRSEPLQVVSRSEHPAYMIYTSGSTGRPKGVLLPHRAVCNYVLHVLEQDVVSDDDRVLQFASPSFDTSVEEIFGALCSGATLVLRTDVMLSTLEDFVALCERWRISLLDLPTALWHELCRGFDEDDLPFPTAVRRTIIGGEAAQPAALERWRRRAPESVRLYNTYGPTEATIAPTWAELVGGPLSIGRPIANLGAFVVDASLEPVAVGVVGELCVSGQGLARGYHRRPAETAASFVPHPFGERPGERLYRTGDQARWRADGYLEYHGRVDAQVKIRGFRVELGEIENVLARQPSVREAAVLLRQAASGPRLVAFWTAADDTRADLRQPLAQVLPAHMVPSLFVELPALPKTTSGKIDRRALAKVELTAVESVDEEARDGAWNPLEEIVAGIWSGVLGRQDLRRHDNFFELGGHSLLATQVISRLRQRFELEIPLQWLFARPTVAELAAAIGDALRTPSARDVDAIVPIPRQGRLSLSFAQERLWFLAQLDPESSAYNMQQTLRLEGRLDDAALAAALDALTRRHEVLRTTLDSERGEPFQVVQPWRPRTLPTVDLSALPAPLAWRLARRLEGEERRLPFELAREIMLRARLIRLSADDHLLVLTVHHIAADGWSFGILLRELAVFYQDTVEGRTASLPRLSVQYADFAVWQRRFLSGEHLAAELAFWRRRLEGAPPVLELPADRPRPAVMSDRGGVLRQRLPQDLADGVRALALHSGGTPFMVLLAALEAQIFRLTERRDLVIGAPIAGRNRLEIEGLIGFFLNTLVLRNDVDPGAGLSAMVERVAREVIDAYGHQDLPFEKLVDELQPERNLSHHPLCQVLLNLHSSDIEGAAPTFTGLEVSTLQLEEVPAKLDLNLHAIDSGADGLALSWIYSRDLFDAVTIRRLAKGFAELLAAGLADPERPLAELPLLPPHERQQVLIEWNDTASVDPLTLTCLHDGFLHRAERQPDAPALIFSDSALSYGELARRSAALAHRLAGLGVGPEVRVGLFVDRSLEMVIAVLAVLRAGGAYVPLDPQLPAERLGLILDDSRAGVLLFDPALDDRLPAFDGPRCSVLASLAGLPDTGIEVDIDAENLAYVTYTSGTTGRPKGVMSRHYGAVSYLRFMWRTFDLAPGDRTLQLASLSFDPSVRELFGPLGAGSTVVLVAAEERRDPTALLGRIGEERITHLLSVVPSLLRLLPATERTFPALRSVMTSGEALLVSDVALARRVLGEQVAVVNQYGPTECTMVATFHRVDLDAQPAGVGVILVGRPIPERRIHVVDRRLRSAPIGALGELYVAAAVLTRGYLDRPRQTAASFLPDPFAGTAGSRMYATGDLGRRLPDGRIEFVGRRDYQVKVSGHRVELGEIEAALLRQPGVSGAVVVAWQPTPEEVRLVAYVEAAAEHPPAVDDLRARLLESLPEVMVPGAWIFLDRLPLSPNGKIDRRALPSPSQAEVARSASFVAPRTACERLLGGVWSELLKLERVGVHDNFFHLGGHSLDGIRSLYRLQELLGVELAARALFEAQTLAELATRVEAALLAQLAELDAGDAARRLAELTRTAPPGWQDELIAEDGVTSSAVLAAGLAALSPEKRRLRLLRLTRALTSGLAEQAIPRRTTGTRAPLSWMQETFWFIEQQEQGHSVYSTNRVLFLRGPLDRRALVTAVGGLVDRHEVLRTRFVTDEDGLTWQEIEPAVDIGLPELDFGALRPEDRQDAARGAMRIVARLGFDLGRFPLWRLLLVRTGAEQQALAVVMHHILTDDWSMGGIFFQELAELYNAAVEARRPELPELDVQYADYAAWERERLQEADLEPLLEPWRDSLEGGIPQLDLRPDRPRREAMRYRGVLAPFRFDAELAAGLEERSLSEGTSLYMTLLAAYKILLARRSQQSDVLVASPVANRARRQTEPLLGCFVNMLLLRTRLDGDPTLGEVLARVKETALNALAHQETPFMVLLANFPPPDFAFDRSPFQASFTFLNAPESELRFSGLELEALTGIDQGETDQELALWVSRRQGLEGLLLYDADLFDASTIVELIADYRYLLEEISAHPERRLSSLAAPEDTVANGLAVP